MDETPAIAALGSETQSTTTASATETETVDWEKRYKDTQKSIQERSIENKSLKAENDALAKQLAEITKPNIVVPEEVEDLKYSDPDAWRSEINKLEQEAFKKAHEDQREVISAARQEAANQAELDRRLDVLKAFQTLNPGLEINDEVLASDVPPKFTRKLENGEISFEEFLNDVKTYLTAERKIVKEPLMDDPNLSKQAGGNSPSLEAKIGDSKKSYANEIY